MSGHMLHVVPTGDAVEHTLSGTCVCGPTSETCFDIAGDMVGWVTVHHSLDNREHTESVGIQENPN